MTLRDQGLPNSQISKVLNAHGSGIDESITPQQVHDQLRIERKKNVGLECIQVVKYFQNKQTSDPTFFFTFDGEETLECIFWADGRSIASYLEFEDAVSFDVTYRTNKFALPFAPFTGVNHHRQSTLFGCALLSDETEDSFVWLFEQWLKCMCNKAPTVIITDQDHAIGNAINKVFPRTRHRYCSWHVDKHVMERLNLMHSSNQDFHVDYRAWFYSRSIQESETRWEELKDQYGLAENKWLMNMYDKRKYWVPAYFMDTFTAGSTSTQRSESINAFFDGYVNATTPLNDFVKQYDNALTARRKAEKDEDFRTLNSKPVYVSDLAIEIQAGESYTRKIFSIFQNEFTSSISYFKEKVSKNGDVVEYMIGKSTSPKQSWRTVVYDASGSHGGTLNCSCAKFETEGILCRHIICLMRSKKFTAIPQKYILKRWTIAARYKSEYVKSVARAKEVTPIMEFSFRQKMNSLCELASSSIENYNRYYAWIDTELKQEMEKDEAEPLYTQVEPNVPCTQAEPNVMTNSEHIQALGDPIGPVRVKGRPRQLTRFKSPKEIAMKSKEKQKRKCGECGEPNHYRSTCPTLICVESGKKFSGASKDK